MATRKERIVLEVEDQASKKFAAAAVQAQLFGRSVESIGTSSRKVSGDIDSFSGRLGLLTKAAAAVGPAIAPIGGVAAAGVGVLASQLGFAAVGAGSLIVAAQGVGEALEAVQKADLEPTAENIEAARVAMEKLAPAAQGFVTEFDKFRPVLADIQHASASGWFPGLTESLDSLAVVGPRVADIFLAIGKAGGDLAARGAEALAGSEWGEFFDFIEAEAPKALSDLGTAVGNVGRAFAELWMAFDPLTSDFNNFLVDSTDAFADWAAGLAETEGFAEFVAYVREAGPQVADAFVAMANAVVQVAQAAAPLGGPILAAIEGFARAVGTIADSDLGGPIMGMVTAMSALSLGTQAADKIMSGWAGRQKAQLSGAASAFTGVISAQDRARMSADELAAAEGKRSAAMRTGLGTVGRYGAALGGLSIAATGVADGFGLSNTASMAMMGTLAGPWGAAVGAGVGLVMDFSSANAAAEQEVAALTATFDAQTGAITENTRAKVAQMAQQQGLFDDAAKLGISAETVTDAIMGQAQAQAQLNAVMADAEAARTADTTTEKLAGVSDQAVATFDAAHALTTGVASLGTTFGSASADAAELASAMDNTSAATSGAANGSADFAERTGQAADASRRAAEAAQAFSDALAGLSGWLDKRAALRAYDDAMRELSKSMRNGFTRADVENLDAVGRSIVQVATNLKAGKVRNNFIDESIASLREMAQGAGPRARAELQGLIAQLRKLGGTKAEPKVGANDKEFKGKVRDSNADLKRLDREKATPKIDVSTNAGEVANQTRTYLNNIPDEQVFINVIRRTAEAAAPVLDLIRNPFGPTKKADGGQVFGPGGPRDDVIPALLSNREFVMPVTAVDHYGENFMEQVRTRSLPAFAGGGIVLREDPRDAYALAAGATVTSLAARVHARRPLSEVAA